MLFDFENLPPLDWPRQRSEQGHGRRVQRDSSRVAVFGEVQLDESGLEVDCLPRHREQLAQAHPGFDRKAEDVRQLWRGRCRADSVDFQGRQPPIARPRRLWAFDEFYRVVDMDSPRLRGLRENVADQGEISIDRRSTDRAFATARLLRTAILPVVQMVRLHHGCVDLGQVILLEFQQSRRFDHLATLMWGDLESVFLEEGTDRELGCLPSVDEDPAVDLRFTAAFPFRSVLEGGEALCLLWVPSRRTWALYDTSP